MKALSLRPEWAHLVLCGEKTIECRSWQTDYRGDVLICSSSVKRKGCISGHGLIVAELVDIHELTADDLEDACMSELPDRKLYAWVFDNFRDIKPFPVKGQLKLFDVNDAEIVYTPAETDEEAEANYNTYWKPLFDAVS